MNINQELVLQLVLLQGQQSLLDAQAALVLVRKRRRRGKRRQPRTCWVHSFTYLDTTKYLQNEWERGVRGVVFIRSGMTQ